MARRNQAGLFEVKTPTGGPTYQMVWKTMRELFPAGDEEAQQRKRRLSGWIGLASKLATLIDTANTPAMGVGPVSAELRATMEYIEQAAGSDDVFGRFMEELTRGGTTAPHPEV